MADTIFQAFLKRQYEEAMELAAQSDILDLQPLDGTPTQRYLATFHAKGLVKDRAGRVVEADGCAIGIWLPDDYLRRAETPLVVTYLGPPRPWHPNIMPPFICLHLTPGMPLVDLLHTLYEVWTYHLFNVGDEGLNHACAEWVRHQDPTRFPVDLRPMKRRKLHIDVTPVDNALAFGLCSAKRSASLRRAESRLNGSADSELVGKSGE